MPNYSFGSFVINQNANGLGYFLMAREFNLPTVAPVTFAVARRDGMKKSGEQVKERTIGVMLKIIGTSRTDLKSRIDTLQQALSLRSQTLCIQDDGRYYQSVDAIAAPVKFEAVPELCCSFRPLSRRGRRESRVPIAPMGPEQKVESSGVGPQV